MRMRGLRLILMSNDAGRVRLAYEMALVQQALGGAVHLFVTGAAVATLTKPDNLRDEALSAGAQIIACQTALAEHDISIADLDPRIGAGGLVSVMQGLGDDRLIVL